MVLEYPGNWNATFDATLAPGATGASIEIYGTEGRMQIDRKGFTFTPAGKGAEPTVVKATVEQTQEHVRNFLDCLKTREEPNGDVYVGHRSAQASHLGNLAWEQKRRIAFNPGAQKKFSRCSSVKPQFQVFVRNRAATEWSDSFTYASLTTPEFVTTIPRLAIASFTMVDVNASSSRSRVSFNRVRRTAEIFPQIARMAHELR